MAKVFVGADTAGLTRALTKTPGWEPPALLNDFYREVA